MSAGFFDRGASGLVEVLRQREDINHIIVRGGELGLRKVGKQVLVAAMAIGDNNFLAAVSRHLVGSFLQKLELNFRAVSYRAGFVARFENLSKIIFGEDNGKLLLRGGERNVPDIEQVGAEREVGAVFFENSNRKYASELSPLYGIYEVGCCQLFPLHD